MREFVRLVFNYIGVDLEFIGDGVDEYAVAKSCTEAQIKIKKGDVVLRVDPVYYRPTEVDLLIGDSSKAERDLGWQPKITLEKLVEEMMEFDLKMVEREKLISDSGYNLLDL